MQNVSQESYDYLIVGAGPAGLQMGYYLERAKRSYLVLEASATAGSFFEKYPRHRTLLSLNKRYNFYPEPEFNLRHDWNSLLSDDPSLLFRFYSKELYPSADDITRYMHDYAEKLKIKIRYNTRVKNIGKNGGDGFLVLDEAGNRFTCKRLLMATGPVKPLIPPGIEGIEHASGYEDHILDPSFYENKRVAILGRGNSAFEVANHLAGHAAIINLLVEKPVKHAWQTHFVGDLRAINNTVLDMYQLKSLHATVGFRLKKIIKNQDGTLKLIIEEDLPHWKTPGTTRTSIVYDHVIRCTGWRFMETKLFEKDCLPEMDEKGKYPILSSCWESTVPNCFFMGTAMASRDRRAASGFIHGFRYNVRSLFYLLEERYYGQRLPNETFDLENARQLDEVSEFLIKRISTTSALYQMNGFLCDVMVLANGRAQLYYELPLDHIFEREDFREAEHLCVFTLEYGFRNYPPNVPALDFIHPADADDIKCSAFLHPVMRSYARGTFEEEALLGESLVVRYDHYDYQENIGGVHKNTIKNFLNRRNRITPEIYPEVKYPEEIFHPWPEERVQELEKDDMYPESRCKFRV